MADDELKSTVIALQLQWRGAYAIGTTPACLWFAIPVAEPDARLEADGPAELQTLIKADHQARARRAIRATAGLWGGNSSC